MPEPSLDAATDDVAPDLRIFPNQSFQTIDGFGGCFNELGWAALQELDDAERQKAIGGLFGRDGCGFNMARVPIGASDFAMGPYSLDDTPGDLKLEHFSIERDQKSLIPYIKAAMRVQPGLKCWGSPWSPPAWMKTNNNYSSDRIRFEPDILTCYADYLVRWAQAYRAQGIKMMAIAPQNEPNIKSKYSSCQWTGSQLRTFIADYLGPALRDRQPDVELWLGTINGDHPDNGPNFNARVAPVMDDPKAAAFIKTLTFQYDRDNLIGAAHLLYPDKKLIESESECFNGDNSWPQAQRLFALMNYYFEGGANSYFAWNMVLNETGKSSWDWRQNSLITIDRAAKKVVLNGEFYVMRHFSQFIKPGARRVFAAGPKWKWGDKIAFVNPDGSTVIVIDNASKDAIPVKLQLTSAGDNTVSVTLPPDSISTFVGTVQSK